MDAHEYQTQQCPQTKLGRLQFRLLAMPRRVFDEYIGADGQPRPCANERERGERFRCFAELLRSSKSSLRHIRVDGSDIYIPPKVCCTAAAILVYRAALERGSCLAWIEWARLAHLRGVEYNSAYKQIMAFAKLLKHQCGVVTGPFEYPRGQRGAVRFSLAAFDVEFSNH